MRMVTSREKARMAGWPRHSVLPAMFIFKKRMYSYVNCLTKKHTLKKLKLKKERHKGKRGRGRKEERHN